jgi:sporulation protein YlmC with PRC-barrel domain
MRKLTVALAVSASLFAASLYAQEAEVKVKTDKKHHYQTGTISGQQFTAKNLIGARVNDSAGQKIGEIEDLLIDPNASRVQFAVVKLNSDLAHGKAFTPVPLPAFRPDMTRTTAAGEPKQYVLTVDRSKLETASRFNVEHWPADRTTVTWGPEVYSHYGMSYDATGATGSEVYSDSGRDYRGVEVKENLQPPINYQEKSVDNGTAPDGKTTFPYLHDSTDRR